MSFRKTTLLTAGLFFSCCVLSAFSAIFEPLFVVEKVAGDVTIEKPNGDVSIMESDHAYPYNSVICVPPVPPPPVVEKGKIPPPPPPTPDLVIRFARDFRFRLSPDTRFTIKDVSTMEDGVKKEVMLLDLERGQIDTFITTTTTRTGGASNALIDANLAAIIVRTPLGECTRLVDRCRISVTEDPARKGFLVCDFSTQSGTMEITAPQLKIFKMRPNAVARIEGTKDFTVVTPKNNEFKISFEKGTTAREEMSFRPGFVGKIWRSYAEAGGRMAVAVMIAMPKGKLKSYTYLEGQEIVSGDASATAPAESGTPAEAPAADDDFFSSDSSFDETASSGDSSENGDPSASGDADTSDSSSDSSGLDEFNWDF